MTPITVPVTVRDSTKVVQHGALTVTSKTTAVLKLGRREHFLALPPRAIQELRDGFGSAVRVVGAHGQQFTLTV